MFWWSDINVSGWPSCLGGSLEWAGFHDCLAVVNCLFGSMSLATSGVLGDFEWLHHFVLFNCLAQPRMFWWISMFPKFAVMLWKLPTNRTASWVGNDGDPPFWILWTTSLESFPFAKRASLWNTGFSRQTWGGSLEQSAGCNWGNKCCKTSLNVFWRLSD